MIRGGGDDDGIWRRSFKQLWELLWAAMEGQRDAKNAALIPGVRTLADSKLGVDLFRGSVSLELYRGSSLLVAAQRLQKRLIYCL